MSFAARPRGSTRELLALAKQSRVRIQLSHQIFILRHTWRTYPAVLRAIDDAAVGIYAFASGAGNTFR